MSGSPDGATEGCAASEGIWCTLQSVLDSVVAFSWPAATALAGVGILTMALIEIVNGVGRIRPRFRRKRFRAMFMAEFPKTGTRTCDHAIVAFELLEGLISYGDPLHVYDEELATTTSRLSAAFRTMLGDATTYENAIVGLAPRIDVDTLETLKAGPGKTPQQREIFTQARALAMGFNQHYLAAVAGQLRQQWSRATQGASVLLSVVVIGVGAMVFFRNKTPGTPTIFFWAIVAIFGGTVAPVAKNIVTALRNVKNRPQ